MIINHENYLLLFTLQKINTREKTKFNIVTRTSVSQDSA